MNGELVVVVAASDIKCSYAHLHLPHERVALCLKSISPYSSAHAGVRADDGELAYGYAIIKLAHPVGVDVAADVVAVLRKGSNKYEHKTDVGFYH